MAMVQDQVPILLMRRDTKNNSISITTPAPNIVEAGGRDK